MAENVTLTNLQNLTNQVTAVNTINSNNSAITSAFTDVVSLSGIQPNSMKANLDMNSNQILNLPAPTNNLNPIRVQDLTTLSGMGTITFNNLPTGGTATQVLTKNSSTNYDASWANPSAATLPTGGTKGQTLVKNSATNYDASWADYGGKVFLPSEYNVKFDGSTDDTAAWQNLWTDVVSNGGGVINCPSNKTTVVFNSGQGLNTQLFASASNVRFNGNGCTFNVGGTFSNQAFQLFNMNAVSNVWIDSLTCNQINPINVGAASPYGASLIWTGVGSGTPSSNITLTNCTLNGGQALIESNTTYNVIVENGTSLNSFYGCVLLDGCYGWTINNLNTNNIDRSLFIKGASNVNASITSINAVANDVLISADESSSICANININYKSLPRTNFSVFGFPASYFYIGNTASPGGNTGCLYRDIRLNFYIDMVNDIIAQPAVIFGKGTTGSLGTFYENIVMSGMVVNVPNSSGNIFDVFNATDASWSGETARNICFRDILVTSSFTTCNFRIDYNPFNTAQAGHLVLQNVFFPGSLVEVNTTNKETIRTAFNTSFSNFTFRYASEGIYFFPSGGISLGAGASADPGSGQIYVTGGTYLARSKATLTDHSASTTATLTNAPLAGNPSKWFAIDDNGTNRFVPGW